MKPRISFTARAGLRIKAGLARIGVGSDIDGLRSYVVVGYGRCSAMLQWQRSGFMLPQHLDGPEHNRAVSIVLRKPGVGELRCLGAHHRWLRGRVTVFDGGADYHYVTRIERGPRVVLMIQRASADAVHP